jgi:chemotaxis protein MotB
MQVHNTRPKKGREAQTGTASWMVTFSDLSTLLLTFFVLLISMSSMDERTFRSLFSNFTSSCGILLFKEYEEIYRPKELLIEGLFEILQDRLVIKKVDDPPDQGLSEMEKEHFTDFSNVLLMEDLKNGFKLVFGQRLVFDPGSAQLKEEVKPILLKIARFTSSSGYRVYIDGHTDNIPIQSAIYASNDDLALARSLNIMDFLVKHGTVSPASLAVGGYGDSNPVAPNDTPEGRAKNRRVEIIIKNQEFF